MCEIAETIKNQMYQHCKQYAGSSCYGYVLENKIIPVSHLPLLPPMSDIYYTEISEELKMKISSMYISNQSETLPEVYTNFAASKGITTIYSVCYSFFLINNVTNLFKLDESIQ